MAISETLSLFHWSPYNELWHPKFISLIHYKCIRELDFAQFGLIQPKHRYMLWLRLLIIILENINFICGMISLEILSSYKFFVYTFVTDVIFCRCASSTVGNRWIKRIRSQSFFLGACKFSTYFIWRICNYHLLNKNSTI